jgi:predicted nuclease of restriction endonuclease-like (RecB) superfamily
MNGEFQFQQLVELCQRTHEELCVRAARVVDAHLVVRNWLFGYYIAEFEQKGADRAQYGARLLRSLAESLKPLKVKGTSITRLKLYRSFYRLFPIGPTLSDQLGQLLPKPLETGPTPSDFLTIDGLQLRQTLSGTLLKHFTLGWSHYVALLTIDNLDERRFYEIEAAQNNWSVRELERQIAISLYERLALSRNKEEIRRLAEQGLVIEKAADIIKNPLVLEFLGIEEKHVCSEEELESAIIDKLQSFLLELGKGFLFEARQKRFTFENDHFYVDLVFYNRLLRCYVLIDLKRDKLTHQDLGQMQMYVNYFDRYVKTGDELSTIGIVLCRRKNDALVELTLPNDANIFAPKYQLYLPSKDDLKRELENIEAELIGFIQE